MFRSIRTIVSRSVLRKAVFISILIIAVIMAASAVMTYYIQLNSAREKLEKDANLIKRILSEPVAYYLENEEYSSIDKFVSITLNSTDLYCVLVYDRTGELAVGKIKDSTGSIINYDDITSSRLLLDPYMKLSHQLFTHGEIFGRVEFYFTDRNVRSELALNLVGMFVKIFIIAGLCIGFLVLMFKRYLVNPILSLQKAMIRFSQKDYSVRTAVRQDDEIGDLANHFNHMADMIEKHNKSLEGMVIERTRQLLQAEKMASLGELVAGVSHEINTPVGVSITAVTHLKLRTAVFVEMYHANQLTKQEMDGFINDLHESTYLIYANLQKAADLVQSFKKVAVDRSTEQKRRFKVREHLDEVLLSLKPRLKKTKYKVDVECDDDLAVTSYPGSLSQVITNLIMNSLLHGFENREDGTIRFSFTTVGSDIVFKYHDDGIGIPQESISKIFDPFFTTKRNAGGTGLGLNIIINIVNQSLGGTISCESPPGEGTTFIIIFPAVLPG